MITVNQLRFSYKHGSQPALDGLALQVPPKSVFGLLGPNGAGKTTLLSVLSGLLACPENTVFIDGQAIGGKHEPIDASLLSLVPQEYAFYNPLTVKENLQFFGGAQGLDSKTLKARIAEVADIAGLAERLQQQSSTLSGGLKRRLNLAIGLLTRPRLLLLDEPTVGIDPQSRHFILEAIKGLNQQGTTVVYTSHYMEEVQAICDQVAIIDNGKVLLQGSLADLLAKAGAKSLVIRAESPLTDDQIAGLQQIRSYEYHDYSLTIQLDANIDIISVLEKIKQAGINICGVQYGAGNLEDLFLDLTQRTLRD